MIKSSPSHLISMSLEYVTENEDQIQTLGIIHHVIIY